VIAVPTLGVSGASLSHLVFNAVWLVVCMAVFESRVQQTSAAPVTLVPGPEDEP
jgi:membrane associated rhomboid family serine protease